MRLGSRFRLLRARFKNHEKIGTSEQMTDKNSAVYGTSPLGKGSPDARFDTQKPAQITQLTESSREDIREAGELAKFAGGPDAKHTKVTGKEESESALEPDLPTDGRDEVGEAMIRDLPKRELSDAPPEPADRH